MATAGTRRLIRPFIAGERSLFQAWQPRVAFLEQRAALGLSPGEITTAYEQRFPPAATRAELTRCIQSTQTTVIDQTASELRLEPDEVRDSAGPQSPNEDLISEIDLGLNRMLLTWQLDYSRRLIEPEVRADQVDILISLLNVGGTTRQAMILLALEALRKPAFGAEASASLVSQPPTQAEIAQAESVADLAEAALTTDNPTPEMLEAVDLVTEREVFTDRDRVDRAENAQVRLSRRTVTQTQGETARDVQTSMGITGYLWVSQRDGRVRPTHRQFDRLSRGGRVWTWARGTPEGNPGDPYGCRCVAVPVINGVAPFIPGVAL